MSDLTDFLLARIVEDGALLEREDRVYGGGGEVWTIDAHARVLAECEVKRRIMEMLSDSFDHPIDDRARWILETLALPYADHPDYRDEWRP